MIKRVAGPWVVYRVTGKGRLSDTTAVCESGEWDTMEAARPGVHTLLRAGIGTEGEAERLARGTAGDAAPPAGERVRAGVLLGFRDAPGLSRPAAAAAPR